MWQSGRSTNSRWNLGTFVVLGLVTVVASTALAQAPPIPATPAVPQAVPAAPTGFLGKCTSCVSSLGGCFKGCCNKPLGRLLNGAVKPLEMATGGVISAPCPDPDEPSKHSDGSGGGQSGGAPGPQQAAEAIKKDQAQAKARCEAVKYLATVPCHYYPEAEAGLILALRTDRSECVRWEAAHALAQGCCCTKKTIEALKITASGSQKDGNPGEKSFRVKVEALNALEHCLAMCGNGGEPQRPELPAHIPEPEAIPTPLPQPKRPEMPVSQDGTTGAGVQQVNYYEEIEKQSSADLLAEARRLVDSSKQSSKPVSTPRQGRSLLALWQRSDRSEDLAADSGADTAPPIRVELPGEDAPGVPTLAPPSSAASQVDMVYGRGPTVTSSPTDRPYANTSIDPRYPQYPPPAFGDYGQPSAGPEMVRQEAVSHWNPLPPAYATPPSYGQWPSASLPQNPPAAPAMQTLPPPKTSSPAPRATPPATPGQISAAMGQQGYLYPSTDTPARSYRRQPTQVVQQPEWVNPLPRR